MVDDQSVVLEWKLFPSRETLSSGEAQQASQLYLPQWISATVHINNPQISYTTKVIIPPTPLLLAPKKMLVGVIFGIPVHGPARPKREKPLFLSVTSLAREVECVKDG